MVLKKSAIIAISVVIPLAVVLIIAIVLGVVLSQKSGSGPSGALSVAKGGTGTNTLETGKVLVGNGADAVLTTKSAPVGDFVGVTDTQTLTNKTIQNSTFSSGNIINSLSSPLPVNSGGTGKSTLASGAVLVGQNSTIINDSNTAPSGNFVGTTDSQTITNKTLNSCTISSLNSPIGVASGGTSSISYTASKVLLGNGTGTFFALKDAPGSNFMGTTDTQTVTNKTFGTGTVISTLSTPLSQANGGTALNTSTPNSYVATDGTSNIEFIPTPLPNTEGGTGLTSLGLNKFLTTDGSGNLETTVDVPSSAVASTVGTTFTNKTIQNSTISTVASPLAVSVGGLGGSPTANKVLVGNGTSAVTELSVPGSDFVSTTGAQTLTGMTINNSSLSLSTPLTIAQGGTGQNSLTSGGIITANSGATGYTTTPNTTGAFVGISDTQTITNKTITASTNNVTANYLSGNTDIIAIMPTTAIPDNGKTIATVNGGNQCSLRWLPNTLYFSATGTKTITLSNTAQSIIPTVGYGTTTFPGNTLLNGAIIDFEIYASVSGGGTSFSVPVISCGFTSNMSPQIQYPSSSSVSPPFTVIIKGRIEIKSTGYVVGYSVYVGCGVLSNFNLNPVFIKNDPTVLTADFTQNQTFDVQFGGGTSGTPSLTTNSVILTVTDTSVPI